MRCWRLEGSGHGSGAAGRGLPPWLNDPPWAQLWASLAGPRTPTPPPAATSPSNWGQAPGCTYWAMWVEVCGHFSSLSSGRKESRGQQVSPTPGQTLAAQGGV